MSDVQRAFDYWSADWWPEQVKTIFYNALLLLGGDESPLTYGPGHIVWCDDNFSNSSIEFCVKSCDDWAYWCDRFTEWDLVIVRRSLEQLLTVPEDVRDCCPYHCWPDDDTEEETNVS